MIKIQIPATSANLGAGFDALGLALTYYNYIEMEECDKIDITAADLWERTKCSGIPSQRTILLTLRHR